jgi:hypothetical protein
MSHYNYYIYIYIYIKKGKETTPGISRIQAIGLLETMRYVEDNKMKQRTEHRLLAEL